MNKALFISVIFFLGLFFHGCKTKETKSKTLMFVGSFTDKKAGEGIHVYEFNNETGEAQLEFTLDSVINTSFLKLSPDGKYLYAVAESQMPYHGKIASFKIDPENSKIHFINEQDCGGLNPAHLEIDKTGKYLVNSNYSDGSLSLFETNIDGSLEPYSQVLKFKDSSIIKSRQESSHMHSANFSPESNYVFAQDLGADKIRRFEFFKSKDSVALLNQIEIKTKLGSGPRHFAFHPNGKFGYCVAELSGDIIAFNYQNGALDYIADYPSYEQKLDIYRTADIHISPDGKFLYASNRGPEEDSISFFLINEDGSLVLVGHEPTYGKHPRNFGLSPSGDFLLVANQFSNNVVVFRRNIETGKLIKLPYEIPVGSPSSIQMYHYSL
ncbi:lactonase family protein [Seonamhaeicola aphaedonensis]|uniref:6-phosphogluconolactonase (Cycloisomerase 2 family) n=1 Tax=Seonamhaeicola aphaedonensis TaxID=1461338 RepID=A0A3D9HEF9_9FLAO|nr:lactonase family protein [Seonamhaeicola aphaedonensis]RED47872.1 6-phosphogluconolactonase (cycloisomerase 2 family) [Seonamhaeicola aphaedonensis]